MTSSMPCCSRPSEMAWTRSTPLWPTRRVTMAMTGLPSLCRPNLSCRAALQAALPSCEGVGIVVLDDVGVGGGVKDIHVDAVQDAAELILLLAQQAVQTMAEPRVQDLLGIGGADGSDLVGGLDRALHEVGTAVIFHNMGVAGADAAGILENVQTVLALVLAMLWMVKTVLIRLNLSR